MNDIRTIAAACALAASLVPMSIVSAADKEPPLKTAALDDAAAQAVGHAPATRVPQGKRRDNAKVMGDHPAAASLADKPTWNSLTACPLDPQGTPRCRASW
jgi:hypothetical protein